MHTIKNCLLASLLPILLTACGDGKDIPVINITTAPANGLTEAAMDNDYLKKLQEETRNIANERLAETYERNDVPLHARTSRARTEGRYVELEGKKMASLDLTYSEQRTWVSRITALKGAELITVSCISPYGKPIDILDPEGECNEAIRENLLDD